MAMDRYKKLERIGEGSYGIVFKAEDSTSNELVALKEVQFEENEEGIPPTTLREIMMLRLLAFSPHVVKLLGVEYEETKVVLVLEYFPQDLNKFIDNQPLPSEQVKSFMHQLLKGIADCHNVGVLHRDLNPRNLLVDETRGILKIADLGLGRAFANPNKVYTNEVGTLAYLAPEILLQAKTYFTGIDMWSIGCIFAEMANGEILLPGVSESDQLKCIYRLLGTPTETIWPGVTGLKKWNANYHEYEGKSIAVAVPFLCSDGVDLLML